MNDMPPPAHIWDAGTYHSHSSIQFDAAKELIASLDLRNVHSAIDLGCGDGKITAQLARSLPEAEILGIDASPDMIRFANETFPQNRVPNLTFQLQNIADLNETGSYDFVSSFFALQWLEDIGAVYGKIRRSLKPSGVFAWIVPRHISAPLNQALEELSSSPEWAEHFQSFHPGWHFRGPGELSRHLQNQGFEIRSLAEVRQEMRFASRGDLEKFVTPWLSHLDRIPPALKQSFSEQLFNRYLELEPPAADGTVPYIYYRIECVAIPRNAEATDAKN